MKHLLCYGDSNTWGLIPKTEDRYGWGTRWTSILQEKLGSDHIRIVEEGLCGRTSVFDDAYREHRNGLKTLPMILETYRPLNGAVLMLGTNDCKSIYHPNAYKIAKGMEQCLDLLLTKIPKEGILVVSPIHLGEEVWKENFDPEFDQVSVQVSKELYKEYEKITKAKGVALINAADFAKPSQTDQEHMTEEGHKALADAIYCAILKEQLTER